MPSSPGYVRDYAQEYKTAKARGEVGTGHGSGNAERHRLRRKALKLGMVKKGDGKDVDHREPISKGGSNSISNARVESAHDNRSYARHADGSMVSNKPKT
jgi:hypothetical protein